MRTSVKLDDDVAAEVARLRKERGIGVSEAVNELARAGASTRRSRRSSPAFRQKTADLGWLST